MAEELLGTKAYYFRAGVFKDVDVVLFAHVSDNFGASIGPTSANGLISVEYAFKGESAHAAGAPWRGRSALDAVELMDVGWNFRREHLRLATRVHYVISNGGDQPNVVPPNASVWYYYREADYDHIMNLWHILLLHCNVLGGDAVSEIHCFTPCIHYQNCAASSQCGLSYFISTSSSSHFLLNLARELLR